MPLPVHSGTAAIDLRVSGTFRQDISEVLLVALTPQNNALGTFQVGAEFADAQAMWTEDVLNQFKITGDTGASLTAAAVTINVSQSDAAVLKAGYILSPDTVGTPLGKPAAEQLQITGINATALTVTRAYAGTAVTYPQNTVFRVVATPINPNSDLGPDMSRARLSKVNYIYRQRKDVNIDSEAILKTHQGYVPGIVDELGYQLQQRFAEFLRDWNNALLYSYANATGNPTNEFQTMNGLLAWLDTTANSTAAPITTAQPFSDTVLNNAIANIYKQGAVSKVILLGVSTAQVLSGLYSDTIRREQSDRIRGFWTQVFDPAVANPHEVVMDAFIQDTAGARLAFVCDPDRIFVRPSLGEFLYTLEAPSFRDGDAVSLLGKMSLEVRNSGTDAGYAHVAIQNLS